ncbi:MAG: bifunctional hydroxymethylpyrimidine kinase/phosphomethylpyrimidine kinase [Polyangiales bacterium]
MALAPSPTLTALTIAGSDPSGGAGVQADLRAFEALGVHGASVLTVVTAQGTRGVRKVDPLRPPMVRAQLDAVFEDLAPRAAKTGALGNAAVVEIVADALRTAALPHVVVDPVINPTLGRALLDDSGFTAFVREVVPLASLIVPNRDEAARLSGRQVRTLAHAKSACKAIAGLGAKAVLLKGGHFAGAESVDLFFDGGEFVELRSPRLDVPPMHGLGCTISALIAALLARGETVRAAATRAHAILHHALAHPRRIGEGLCLPGPLTDAVAATAPAPEPAI